MIRLPNMEWRMRRPRMGRWTMVVLSSAALGAAALLYMKSHLDQRLRHSQSRLEQVLARSLASTTRRRVAGPVRTPAEVRQLNAQIALLNRDWAGLLDELVPGEQDVKLLGLDVNAATGVVRLTGRAADGQDANAYAEALQSHEASLSDVRLLLLERKSGGIHFEVSARWQQ